MRMTSQRLNPSHHLLNWILQRGQQSLAVQLSRAGKGYKVRVSSPGQKTNLYAESCERGPNALRLHAELVNGFRDAGWRSVAYR
jgi:hypothetical protein